MLPSDYLKKGFCTNAYAKDKDGNVILETSKDATSWCLVGACVAWWNFLPLEQKMIPAHYDFSDAIRTYTKSKGFISASAYSDKFGKEAAIKAAEYVEGKLGLSQ